MNTGLDELEILSFDWETIAPGMFTTLCCASGTCDIYLRKQDSQSSVPQIIANNHDAQDAYSIQQLFGNLRTA